MDNEKETEMEKLTTETE